MSEDLCTRCGLCCRSKELKSGLVMLSEEFCEYYDKEVRGCSRYETRHEVPWCLKIEDAIKEESLPNSCPYVPKGYVTRIADIRYIKRHITQEDVEEFHGKQGADTHESQAAG